MLVFLLFSNNKHALPFLLRKLKENYYEKLSNKERNKLDVIIRGKTENQKRVLKIPYKNTKSYFTNV